MADSDHPIRCRCGQLQGWLAREAGTTRATCYCRDCQAYAHVLGEAGKTLDASGGTDVIATLQSHVRLTQGVQELGCLSLKPSGLLRWYARCCQTPIANTTSDPRMAYVGLVHTALAPTPAAMDARFGPTRLLVNTRGASGALPGVTGAAWWQTLRVIARVAGARLSGAWRRSPFFDEAGQPVVARRVLTREELEQARRKVPAGH